MIVYRLGYAGAGSRAGGGRGLRLRIWTAQREARRERSEQHGRKAELQRRGFHSQSVLRVRFAAEIEFRRALARGAETLFKR